MKRIILLSLVGVALLAGAGPAHADRFHIFTTRVSRPPLDKKLPPIKRLAILPFKGNLGEAASHLLMDTLNVQDNGYEILDRDHLDLTAAERGLVDQGLVDPARAAALGKMHGCQAIVVGSLDGWSGSVEPVVHNKVETNPLSSNFGKSVQHTKYKQHINVNVSIQMINVETSVVISPISRPVPWTSQEIDYDPGAAGYEKVLDKVLSETIWEFVKHISPYKTDLKCGLDTQAHEDSTRKLVQLLNAGRTERAIEKAKSQNRYFAQKGDIKQKAASLYNLGIVYEIADSIETALSSVERAQDLLIEADEKIPGPYVDASKRLKGELKTARDLQDQGN